MEENKSGKKLEEANFEVSSLSEVKDENGNGIFHLRTKTKFILPVSAVILLSAGALIYLTLENYFAAEIWQLAVWGLCAILAIYSMFAKSVPTMLLNVILFFGVSLIPVWQAGHETFRPVIEKFTSEETPVETPAEKVEEVPKVEQPAPQSVEKVKPVEEVPAEKPVQEKTSSAMDLPSI